MTNFTELKTWQETHRLAIMCYEVSKTFPREDLFGITNQLRRSSSSTPSNIAEGFGRETPKDKFHFYVIARGSLTETQNHCLFAKDINILPKEKLGDLLQQIEIVARLLHGLLRSTRRPKFPVPNS